jgi:hypothetical protein
MTKSKYPRAAYLRRRTPKDLGSVFLVCMQWFNDSYSLFNELLEIQLFPHKVPDKEQLGRLTASEAKELLERMKKFTIDFEEVMNRLAREE